jgi:hypothetical protein
MIFEKIENRLNWKSFSENPHDKALCHLAKHPIRIHWPTMLKHNTNANVIELMTKVGIFDPISLKYKEEVEFNNLDENDVWMYVSSHATTMQIITANEYRYSVWRRKSGYRSDVELAKNPNTDILIFLFGSVKERNHEFCIALFANPNPLAMQYFIDQLYFFEELFQYNCNGSCYMTSVIEEMKRYSVHFYDTLLLLETKTTPMKKEEKWFVNQFKNKVIGMARTPNAGRYLATKPIEFFKTESLEWFEVHTMMFWYHLSGNSCREAVAILVQHPNMIDWNVFCRCNTHPDAYQYMLANINKVRICMTTDNGNPDVVNFNERDPNLWILKLLRNPASIDLIEKNMQMVTNLLDNAAECNWLTSNTSPSIVHWILRYLDKITDMNELSRNPVIFESAPCNDGLYVLK